MLPFKLGSVWTALPTLLGPRTLITHGLQRLMGCILRTMHCRSQHCWELLHLFAHHCQHARNNSQAFFVATAPKDGALRSSQNKLFTIIGQPNNDWPKQCRHSSKIEVIVGSQHKVTLIRSQIKRFLSPLLTVFHPSSCAQWIES